MRFIRMAVIVVALALLPAVPAAATTHKTTTTTHPQSHHKSKVSAKQAAFLSWANHIRSELAPCEAGPRT